MMKFLKVFLLSILTIVLLAAAGLVIFVYTFDLNKYKPMITKLVQEQIGRELRIDGDARLGISFVPTVIVNDVKLANAPFGTNPYMISVETIEVQVSLLPLLDKKIVIDNVSISKPQIYLDVDQNGKANWDFDMGGKEEVSAGNEAAKPVAGASADDLKSEPSLAVLAGLAAKNVSIKDGLVRFNDMAAKKDMSLVINNINVSAPDSNEKISLDVDVVFDKQPIQGAFVFGSINSFIDKEPFSVGAFVQAYGVKAMVDGVLYNILEDLSFDLKLSAHNPKGNFGAPEIKLQTGVKGDLKKVSLAIVSLEAAKNVISGNVAADISGEVPHVKADLTSGLINLESFSEPAKTAFGFPEIISSAQATMLVPDEAIPFDLMKLANAEVKLTIGTLIINQDLHASNVLLAAALNNGVLDVKPLSLGFGQGKVNASAHVDGNTKTIALKALSRGLALQELSKEIAASTQKGFGIVSGGSIDLDIDVSTQGATYRRAVQGLDGRMVLIIGESEIKTGDVNFGKYDIISQLLQILKVKKELFNTVNLNCAVVRADFKGGKAAFPEGIAVDSKQIKLLADGKVNLVNDGIDFSLHPSFPDSVDANITGALSSFVKVKGTITAPKAALDEKEAMKAVVGLATNAPVYVGSQLALSSVSSPCYSALAGTTYEARFPRPTGAQAAGQNIYKNTARTVNDSVKTIKTTTKESVNNIKGQAKDLENTAKSLLNSLKGKK